MSITAVPLRPIAKGSVTRLWIGIALVVAAAGGLAWAGQHGLSSTSAGFFAANAAEPGVVALPSGVQYKVLEEGKGPKPTAQDVVLVGYKGELTDGTVFDQNEQTAMPVDGVVPGFSEGLQQMQRGGRYKLWIPATLGYGAEAKGPIPANSTLIFEVHLLDFKSKAEIQAMQQQMQLLQQHGAGAGGAPVPAPAPGQ